METDDKDRIASLEEVKTAFFNLTETQRYKLMEIGRLYAFCVNSCYPGVTADDLLQETFSRALAIDDLSDKRERGVRKWRPEKVDFFGFVKGSMKSIADEWKSKNLPMLASERDTEIPATEPSDQKKIDELILCFSSDEQILNIISGHRAGMNGPEIQEALEISAKEYNTAMKKLFRKARKNLKGEENE